MADENREKTLSHLSLFQIFRRISRSVREFKRPALLTPLLVTGEVIIECTIPFITAQLINALNEGQGMDAIAHYSLILVALALVSLACGTVAGITCANASTGLARNLRHDMFHNIQSFSFGNIDRFSTSSLVTRLTTDVGFVQMAFMQIIRTAIRSPLMLVFAIFMAYITGGALATVYVIVAILLGTFLFGIALYVMPIFRRLFRKYDALNDTVEENIKGIRVVKAFVREKYEKQKFDTSSGNLRDDFLHAERLLAWNMPVMQLAINVVYVFVIFFGSRAIVESQGTNLALGQLSALITYGFSILMSLNMLSMIFVMLTMSEESARRIVEVLVEESDLSNPENPVYEVADGSIDFEHVSFEYAGNTGEKALADIDLHTRRTVDVQTIYHYMEPRNLRAAYRFYCGGKDFENAHTAEADTMATYEVLKAQLDMYREADAWHEQPLQNDIEFLSGVGGRPKTIDYAGRLVRGKGGEAVINFGKHRGKTAREVYEVEPAYFAWIENGEFTMDTKRQFARLKEQFDQERSKPLDQQEMSDALNRLKGKFEGGKLF